MSERVGKFAGRGQYRHLYKRADWYARLRPQHLEKEPLCRDCLRRGIANDGTLTSSGQYQANAKRHFLVADHIVPHRGDEELFFDPENLQTLCPDCHDRNKQREEAHGYSEQRGEDGWPIDPRHPANR